jgi:hypothetical protein
MERQQIEDLVSALVSQDVEFIVPGYYNLPNHVIIQFIEEFLESGDSQIIDNHKKWT